MEKKQWKIVNGYNISADLFREFLSLENRTWPVESDCHLPASYLKEAYTDGRGLFLAVDQNTGTLAGYLNVMIVSRESFEAYLNLSDFLCLAWAKDDEEQVLYVYTANLDEPYQGTDCIKVLGKAMADYLDELDAHGCLPMDVYCEAVSKVGAKMIRTQFMMDPMSDVDECGLGHYENHDGLQAYRTKMKGI